MTTQIHKVRIPGIQPDPRKPWQRHDNRVIEALGIIADAFKPNDEWTNANDTFTRSEVHHILSDYIGQFVDLPVEPPTIRDLSQWGDLGAEHGHALREPIISKYNTSSEAYAYREAYREAARDRLNDAMDS